MEVLDIKAGFGSRTFRLYIVPGEKVEVHTFEGGNLRNIKVFSKGDVAEYDSFNLSYMGRIEGITKKNAIFGVNGRRKYLSWYDFSWRNWDFDEEETRRSNGEKMTYL